MAGEMTKMTCLVLACMVMAADAQLICRTVMTKLTPCLTYLTKGRAVPPSCCNGVRILDSMVKTTPDRQSACRCLQSAAKSLGSSFNAGAAAALPSKCGVSISYPISTSIDCDNIKY